MGNKKEPIDIPVIYEKYWPSSKNIARTKFYADRHILEVEYTGGKIYHYELVPLSVWLQLEASQSAGTFLNQHVKGVFDCTQIK